jgi:hypothetical protein
MMPYRSGGRRYVGMSKAEPLVRVPRLQPRDELLDDATALPILRDVHVLD